MPTVPGKTAHPWEVISKQLSQEHDRSRVAELTKKLNEAMLEEEREKVRRRLGKPLMQSVFPRARP